MLLLGDIAVCSDPAISNLVLSIKKFLNALQLIGPILGIASLAVHLSRLMVSPDDKKLKNVIKNWVIAIFFLFLLPTVLNGFMKLFDNSFELASCWSSVETSNISNPHTNYYDYDYGVDGSNRTKKYIIGDPDTGSDPVFPGPDDDDNNNSNSNNNTASSQTSSSTSTASLIFIGDSRTVGMHSAVNGTDVWSAKESMGYN